MSTRSVWEIVLSLKLKKYSEIEASKGRIPMFIGQADEIPSGGISSFTTVGYGEEA